MIVRKHDSRGWWAENEETGEVLTKPCQTEKELHEVLQLLATARLIQTIEALNGERDW